MQSLFNNRLVGLCCGGVEVGDQSKRSLNYWHQWFNWAFVLILLFPDNENEKKFPWTILTIIHLYEANKILVQRRLQNFWSHALSKQTFRCFSFITQIPNIYRINQYPKIFSSDKQHWVQAQHNIDSISRTNRYVDEFTDGNCTYKLCYPKHKPQ